MDTKKIGGVGETDKGLNEIVDASQGVSGPVILMSAGREASPSPGTFACYESMRMYLDVQNSPLRAVRVVRSDEKGHSRRERSRKEDADS